ncbi:hypothetical protein [Bacillus suaedaesalsae]|uniref:Uncharacterized protein n=1 Tax=Bacillus suaedaesalsae TaxID=2810349 RepID=A0ABS2DG54_9BACI|nr:hypothetical protein [Bacillus suaedaesalsae]MBM6617469.1 hypothetical protein [Bacillus suaedaesalsae]
MRIVMLTLMLAMHFVFFEHVTMAADYTNSLLFKVTLENKGEEIEYEYENPTHYEWEVGSKVTKGEEAKKKVEQVFAELNVTSNPTVEELKESLERYGYSSIDKFVVKWIDPNGNLFTWHWDKSEDITQQ